MGVGKIVQVQGPVVDAHFAPGDLPNILNALKISDAERHISVTVEVSQHLGNDVVRCIAMSTTDGLMRGMDVTDTGAAISVPVGEETLGRVFNLLGEPIDKKGDPGISSSGIRSTAPPRHSKTRQPTFEVLETGIKVIDLLCPYPERRQDRPVRRRRCRQNRHHAGADPQYRDRAWRRVRVCRCRRADPRRQ